MHRSNAPLFDQRRRALTLAKSLRRFPLFQQPGLHLPAGTEISPCLAAELFMLVRSRRFIPSFQCIAVGATKLVADLIGCAATDAPKLPAHHVAIRWIQPSRVPCGLHRRVV